MTTLFLSLWYDFGNNIRVVPVNYREKVSETCFSSFFVGVVKKKGVYLWKMTIYCIWKTIRK